MNRLLSWKQQEFPAPKELSAPARIVFVSANLFGRACLKALLEEKMNVVGVMTLAEEFTAGTSDRADFSEIAASYKLPLERVRRTNDAASKAVLKNWRPDLLIVIGWSQLVDQEVLNLPSWMAIGAHPALLPKNRGRAAIPWHFINKETLGGLSFFKLEEGCDNGAVFAQESFPLGSEDSATSYYDKISDLAPPMLKTLCRQIREGRLVGYIQDESQATYLAKRTPGDGEIRWQDPARRIYDLIRATSRPYPGAFTTWRDQKIIFWKAEPPANDVPHSSAKPGTVIRLGESTIDVMAGDRSLRIMEWETGGSLNFVPSVGDTLGKSSLAKVIP